MTTAWVYLVIAGIFEWGWPVGLKLGWTDEGAHYGWIAFSIACMAVSGALLLIAQRTIPIGTAYAVWTGIGAAGTFLIGVAVFGDALHWGRVLGVLMIVGGVIVLKAVSP